MLILLLPQQRRTGARDLTVNEWLQEEERKKEAAAEAKQRRIKERQQKREKMTECQRKQEEKKKQLAEGHAKKQTSCKQHQNEATASSVCRKSPMQDQLVNSFQGWVGRLYRVRTKAF